VFRFCIFQIPYLSVLPLFTNPTCLSYKYSANPPFVMQSFNSPTCLSYIGTLPVCSTILHPASLPAVFIQKPYLSVLQFFSNSNCLSYKYSGPLTVCPAIIQEPYISVCPTIIQKPCLSVYNYLRTLPVCLKVFRNPTYLYVLQLFSIPNCLSMQCRYHECRMSYSQFTEPFAIHIHDRRSKFRML
jgi:hypothetical protein